MTQSQALLNLFRENGNRLRRNDILRTGYLGAAYRQRMSDLRDIGYGIECEKEGTDTVFVLTEPVQFEGDQAVMFKEAM